MGMIGSFLRTVAVIATGGLALALLPDDWTGIEDSDGGGDE